MKNITVSIDDETYRQARIRAAVWDTSMSALVRGNLKSLVSHSLDVTGVNTRDIETKNSQRHRLLKEVIGETTQAAVE